MKTARRVIGVIAVGSVLAFAGAVACLPAVEALALTAREAECVAQHWGQPFEVVLAACAIPVAKSSLVRSALAGRPVSVSLVPRDGGAE